MPLIHAASANDPTVRLLTRNHFFTFQLFQDAPMLYGLPPFTFFLARQSENVKFFFSRVCHG